MLTTYNWLKEYCDFNLSIEALTELLTNVGLVVEDVEKIDDDYRIDVEVTSNRPDCLGMVGIAREIAAVTGAALRLPDIEYTTTGGTIDKEAQIAVKDKNLCPHYTARIITNVKVGPSPDWLQKRLHTVGIRPLNNIVDITNYVLMECGQPLHAFDLDKLRDKKIIVRHAKKGEKLVAINGTEYSLTPEALVIADAKKPVAIAGVMGGVETEVSSNTKNILLECARFEPTNIRRTSRRLKLTSDSSFRFERGVDPEGVDRASMRAAKLINEIAGGQPISGVLGKRYDKLQKRKVVLKIDRLNRLLGTTIDKETSKNILTHLQFSIVKEGRNTVTVSVPSFRADVYREVDVIEEIARIYGYDNIPTTTNISAYVCEKNKTDLVEEKIRKLLTGQGFSDVVTYSIVDNSPLQNISVWSDGKFMTLRNTIRKEEDRLRTTLLGNIIKVREYNQNYGARRTQIFEISKIYLPQDGEKLPEEKTALCILSEDGFFALKGAIESILGVLGITESCRWVSHKLDFFNDKKSAKILLGDNVLGFIGELSEGGTGKNVCPDLTELDFDLLLSKASEAKAFVKLPSFPAMTRDVAIVVDEKTTWESIKECVESAGTNLLEAIEFFDVYKGKQVPTGKKSIAFSVRFRAPDRTLKSEEADAFQQSIIHKLSDKLGAVLRT
jgi:phenylalanyl-tRNA synthetase beta chain